MKSKAKNWKWNKQIVLVSLIIIVILIIMIYNYGNTIKLLNSRISQLETDVQELVTDIKEKAQIIQEQLKTIFGLEQDIKEKEREIERQKIQIETLTLQVESLTSQLGKTKIELKETTRLLSIAKNYEDRVEQGVSLSQAYALLGDYDKTAGIVAEITGISKPTTDQELWLRGKQIYEWLGKNYDYCSDKGFCIAEEYCTQIQFFSPDELLYYGSQDVLCGDCDDAAHLFAGMMYASGVPHDKVRVECGTIASCAGNSRHCWNSIYVNNEWYRVDPVCSDPVGYVLESFGLSFLSPAIYPSGEFRHVDCFESYETEQWYNPEGYHVS